MEAEIVKLYLQITITHAGLSRAVGVVRKLFWGLGVNYFYEQFVVRTEADTALLLPQEVASEGYTSNASLTPSYRVTW